ncbi:LuxR C-terminal-related transcriptional regulator [Nocardia xishanensis]|uniref:LuxR C-terminal-related transcriptional regulator n=1 Tax=Nocardia xishanensis TaxID=238964 RepID=A0ABW7WTV3_9NOCA
MAIARSTNSRRANEKSCGSWPKGRSNRAIGTALFLGERTVEAHVRSIFVELGPRPEPDDHRRVLAVPTYLRAES